MFEGVGMFRKVICLDERCGYVWNGGMLGTFTPMDAQVGRECCVCSGGIFEVKTFRSSLCATIPPV